MEIMPGFTLSNIETSGAQIRLRHGGNGPPLLLLHGNPLTHVSWHAVASRLAERFHVVAADLRGYGDSSAPPEQPDSSNYSFRAIAQDEVEVMQAAEVAKILVEADELDRVPADPDPETEPSAAQQVKRGRLLG